MTKIFNSLLVVSALLFGSKAVGQTLQSGQAQLNFGNTTEIAPSTRQVTLTNNLGYPVKVTGVKFFNIYGQPAFALGNTITLPVTIPAGGTQNIPVIFSPKHNIAHNTEMVIETDSHGGNLSVDLIGQGKYSRAYYDNSENLSEQALKTALKTITSNGYVTLSYNAARDKMYMEVDNWKVNGRGSAVNKLECVYTTRIVTNYVDRSNLLSAHNINAEHTYPQGLFGSATPMVSDMHHLFPTDASANSSRGNQPFGIATQPYRVDNINNPSHLGQNMIYEPHNGQKGATARAMLYFVIRYQDYQSFFAPQEAILKTWNKNFLPTAVDVKRNDDIAAPSRQKNRNPFVDYPQLADRITSFVSNSAAPASHELYQAGLINYGQIPANTTYTYNYVLVNNGNQPVNFSNLALSNPAILNFAAGSGSNFSIAPGEAYTLKINANLPTTDSIAETLTLNTNIPSQANLSIPVYANKFKVQGPLATAKDAEVLKFEIYPNPVNNVFMVSRAAEKGTGQYEIQVLDALGKQVKYQKSNIERTAVDVSDLKRGIYFVRISTSQGAVAKKIIKL